MNEYVLILGANLPSKFGDILRTLNLCVEAIKMEPLISLIAQSKPYQSESFPDKSNPAFINLGIKIKTILNPYEILVIIERIEKRFGRVRKTRWDSRVCDIDIAYCDNQILPNRKTFEKWLHLDLEVQLSKTPETLILPHPRLQDRFFFLYPLNELSPKWTHPVLKKTAKEMLDSIK